MKKILIICGTGVATSTVVANKVQEHLKNKGVAAQVKQGKVMDLLSGDVDADVIVATTQIPENITVPVVKGLAFITGVGQEAALAELDKYLD